MQRFSFSLLKINNFLLRHSNSNRRFLSSTMSPCNKKKEDYKDYGSLEYWREGRIAHVLLNRPQRLNAIDLQLPFQLQNAIQQANWDDEVHAVLLYGAGNAFCSGYDLISFAEEKVDNKSQERYVNQGPTWDPSLDYQRVKNIT